jgi:hypothetical protein
VIRAADGRTMRTGLTRVLANIGALLALGGPIGLVWLMAPAVLPGDPMPIICWLYQPGDDHHD